MKTKFFNFFVALSIVISACDKDLPHADDNIGIEVKSGTTFFQYKPSSEDEFGNFGKEHKNGKLLVDEDIVIDKTQSGTKVSIGNNAKGWLQVIVWDGNNYDRYTGQVEQGKGQSWHFTGKMVKYYWCICDQGPDDYDGPIPEGDWIEFWNFNWRHFSMTPAVVGAEFCLPTVEDFLKNPKWFYDPEIHIFLGWDVFNVEKQQWQWFQ